MAGAAAAAVVLAAGPGAAAGGAVLVSGPSPLTDTAAGCRVGGPLEDAEMDVALAADPQDPGRLAAAWYQDDQEGVVAARSTDRGRTWRSDVVPGVTACSGERQTGRRYAFDPWIAQGAGGSATVVATVAHGEPSTDPAEPLRDPLRFDVVASTATGDGPWSTAALVHREPDGRVADHTGVAASRVVPGRAWVTWTSLVLPGSTSALLVSRGDDGGWTPPVSAVDAVPGRLVVAGVLLALPDDRLVLVYADVAADPGAATGRWVGGSDALLRAVSSADAGATWSPPRTVASVPPTVVRDPRTGEPRVRGGLPWVFPSAAAGEDGSVWAAWPEAVDGGPATRVRVSRSTDGGRTWSAPRTALSSRDALLTPAVAAQDGQSAAVTAYDAGVDRPEHAGLEVGLVGASTRDAGAAWRTSSLAAPFDLDGMTTGSGSGHVHGDHAGLVATGPVWTSVAVLGGAAAQRGQGDVVATRFP